MALSVIEVLVIILMAGFVLTQIAIPLWRNTPCFPMFRKGRERQLESELKAANQEVEALELQLEIQAARKEAEKLRRQSEIAVEETSTGAAADTEQPQN